MHTGRSEIRVNSDRPACTHSARPKCIDWLQACGPKRWIDPRDKSDEQTDDWRSQWNRRINDGVPLPNQRYHHNDPEAEKGAENSAKQSRSTTLGQELQRDLATSCPSRPS